MAGRCGPTASHHSDGLFPYRPVQAAQIAAPVIAGCLAAAAAALLWRRLAGALHQPLASAGMFSVAATLVLLAALVRLAWRAGCKTGNGSAIRVSATGLLLEGALSALLLISAASISVPGSTAAGLLLLWGPVLLAECTWWAKTIADRQARRSGAGQGGGRAVECSPPAARAAPSAAESEQSPEQTVQQIVRTRTAEGKERLDGWLRLDFAPGQRTAVAHLAFCPPLEGAPTLTVRQRSGPECRVKTAQVLPYGARVELRLVREAAQAQQVVLDFEVRN